MTNQKLSQLKKHNSKGMFDDIINQSINQLTPFAIKANKSNKEKPDWTMEMMTDSLIEG